MLSSPGHLNNGRHPREMKEHLNYQDICYWGREARDNELNRDWKYVNKGLKLLSKSLIRVLSAP